VIELHAISAAASWALGDNHDMLSAAFAQFARAASPLVPVAAQAVLNAMWQGAAVALVLFLSLRLAPRVTAAHRFAAWTAGFAAIAVLPFLAFLSGWLPGSAASASVVSAAASPRAWFELPSRWALLIVAFWLIASALRLGQLVFHLARVHKLWKTAAPVSGQSLHSSKRLPHAVVVCTTNQLDRPSVIGFFAPCILIPHWLYARLTPQELKQIVLHEIEHLRRHDDWTNLIQKLVLVLFPLNPALVWIERRLCREREMACDEGVIQQTNAPRAYAACLASLAERGLERNVDQDLARRAEALSLAAWRRRSELVHRVHGILWRKPVLNPLAARALLGVVACSLVAGSVELARCPQAVAFVSAPEPQQLAQVDAVLPTRATLAPAEAAAANSAYRMVPAVAIVPPSPAAAVPVRRRATLPAATAENQVAVNAAPIGTPHPTLLKAEMPASAAEPPAPQPTNAPQYFVLTAYEQVRTVPQNSREISDYDTGVTQEPASDAQTPSAGNQPTTAPQVVVTRLILRIAPAATQAGTAGSPTGSAISSHSLHQPALIPIGNGWLVFQL
jgi:beta-lactamase regulating signal transducer with metallopeptidase domain